MKRENKVQGRCPMCGELGNYFATKWWAYDNGEQFFAAVCRKCELLHDRLVSNYKK